MKVRYLFLACALSLAACGGGGGGGGNSGGTPPTTAPSSAPGALSVTPKSISLNAAGATQTVTASEGSYSGSFTASAQTTCTGIASIGPATSTPGSSATFTVTAGTTAGSCSLSVSDNAGHTSTIPVVVTITQGTIQ